MVICEECEFYEEREFLRYTGVFIPAQCRSIPVRCEHISPITGTPPSVDCIKMNAKGDCPHWLQRPPGPEMAEQTQRGPGRWPMEVWEKEYDSGMHREPPLGVYPPDDE